MRAVVVLCLALLASTALTSCSQEGQAQSYLERGTKLFEQGELTKARLELKNALQIDPKQAPAWLMLGQVEEAEQHWRPAFNAYNRALELDPNNLPARIKRGTLLVAGGRAKEAREDAAIVLAAEPSNASALTLRGAIKGAAGDLEGGAEDAEAALAIEADHAQALRLLAAIRTQQARPEDAKALLERAVAAHPTQTDLLQALVEAYEAVGDTAAVIEILERLVAQQPQAYSPQLLLARYLATHDQVDAAESILRAAAHADPGDLQRTLTLVQFIHETEGAGAAIAELQQQIDAAPDELELRLHLADRYAAAGQLDTMAATYEALIEAYPDQPAASRARARLAALALTRGEFERAERLAEMVLADDDSNADALLVRAAVHLQRDDSERAIADLRTLLRDEPQSVRALRLLAQAHVRRQEIVLAEDALQLAMEAAPDQAPAHLQLAELRLRSGDGTGAAQVLEEFLERVPDNQQVQLVLARLQLSQHDVAALAITADRVLSTRPEHPLGYYLRGLALQGQEEHAAAIEQFESALEKAPETAAEPVIALARSDLALGDGQRAERRVQRLLADDPDNLVAMNLLGDIYLANGKQAEARAQYTSIIRHMPQSPQAYERLARLQLAAGELDPALETLQIGLDTTGRSLLLLQTLGLAQEQGENLDAAIAAYEEVLQSAPGAMVSANNLAMLIANRQADEPERVARARQLAAAFEDSEQPVLLDTAGWVHYRSGNYGRSVDLLEKAAALGLQSSEHQYHLGMAYLKVGRVREGQALLIQALESGTAFPGIEEARAALETATRSDQTGSDAGLEVWLAVTC